MSPEFKTYLQERHLKDLALASQIVFINITPDLDDKRMLFTSVVEKDDNVMLFTSVDRSDAVEHGGPEASIYTADVGQVRMMIH